MDENLKIIESHECEWINQHKGVEVINYEEHGWTLFVDHSKLEHEGGDEDMEYRVSVKFCPQCGTDLNTN